MTFHVKTGQDSLSDNTTREVEDLYANLIQALSITRITITVIATIAGIAVVSVLEPSTSSKKRTQKIDITV